MYSRKILRTGNSLSVTIPPEICGELGLEKGERLRISSVEGYGFLVLKEESEESMLVSSEGLARMRIEADNIIADLRRKSRAIYASVTFNVFERMIGDLIKSGLLGIDYQRIKDEVQAQIVQEIMKASINGIEESVMRRLKMGPFGEEKKIETQGKIALIRSKRDHP